MMGQSASGRLAGIAPDLERILTSGVIASATFDPSDIRRATVQIVMRDGIRLATDLYMPPTLPAPAIVVRTPYGRSILRDTFVALAQRGYLILAQDCRGTGDSEPATWDYFVYELADSHDFVEWVSQQEWFDGFLGACGGSYLASTQWCMSAHPRMSTIVPEVGGVGVTFRSARLYMFLNSYVRAVGKGKNRVPIPHREMERRMLDETLRGGFFNEPLHERLPDDLIAHAAAGDARSHLQNRRLLWERCIAMSPAQRAQFLKRVLRVDEFDYIAMVSFLTGIGHQVAFGAHSIPSATPTELCRELHAPPLIVSGWYDWNLKDTLATWELLRSDARESVRERVRLLIAPSAHNVPGYHEGAADHPELQRAHRTENNLGLLLHWYDAVRGNKVDAWPPVIYYLMGANEWHVARNWPPPEAQSVRLYLHGGGNLSEQAPAAGSSADLYTYDPTDPTPTVGGSIVSYVYSPGSCDVSDVQKRSDVLSYTTAPLERDLDVAGHLRLILYVSSSAVDTDFVGRLSDVFPDGRAIQLQNGVLRARHRSPDGNRELLRPGRIYPLEIDLWATANRFRAGHRLRVDISSADFPRFDRNTNRGGEPGPPIVALQTVHHDADHPSHLLLSVLNGLPSNASARGPGERRQAS